MANSSCVVKVVDVRPRATSIFQLGNSWQENVLGPLLFNSNELKSEAPIAPPEPSPVETVANKEDALLSEAKSPSLGLSCQGCCIEAFPSLEEQRDHYRSDHHRMNIQRRLKKLAPISLAEFEQLLERFSGLSEDEDESDVEDVFRQLEIESSDSEHEATKLSKEQANIMASPLLWLQLKEPPSSLLGIYRALVSEAGSGWQQIETELADHRAGTWALILLGGGHFVAAIFDNSRFDHKNNKPCVVASKTFHRYTVRRKQGGTQSGNDNSKGKAKSAGANIRRQMEAMLREDIRELLASWGDSLRACRRLFVRAPSANHKIIHPNAAFAPDDARVCSFPFTTKRPTLREAQRCYLELIHPKEAKLETAPAPLPRPAPKPKTDTAPLRPADPLPKPKPQKERPHTTRVSEPSVQTNNEPDPLALDMIDSIVTWIQTADPSQETSSLQEVLAKVQDCDFLRASPNYRIKGLPNRPTVLHLACQYGQAKLISPLLELGCDPTLALPVDGVSKTAFQLAKSKSTKMQFRLHRFHHPDQYDWEKANVPPPISPEERDAKHSSQKLKKKEKPKKKPAPPPETPAPANTKNEIYALLAQRYQAAKLSSSESAKPKPSRPLGSGFGAAKTSSPSKVGFGFGHFLSDKAPPGS